MQVIRERKYLDLFVFCVHRTGAGSASRMLLYLSCPDLKPGEADASLQELNIERRHVSFDQLLIEGQRSH